MIDDRAWCWVCKWRERTGLARLLRGRGLTLTGEFSRSGRVLYVCENAECRSLAEQAKAFIDDIVTPGGFDSMNVKTAAAPNPGVR